MAKSNTCNDFSLTSYDVKNSLEETFYINSKKKHAFHVKLTQRGLMLSKQCVQGQLNEHLIALEHIIGSRCVKNKAVEKFNSCVCGSSSKCEESNETRPVQIDGGTFLYIFCYIPKLTKKKHYLEKTTVVLKFQSFDTYEDNAKEAQKWRLTLKRMIEAQWCLTYEMPRSRSVLVLLNPKAGQKKSRDIFQQQISPILAEAELTYDVYITQRHNFGRHLMRTANLSQWRDICVVGGDGMFFEILNGIMERPDWNEVIKRTNIGIIPCGSGNGLAKSLWHTLNPRINDLKPILTSAVALIKGQTRRLDIIRIETIKNVIYSTLSVGIGFISDIDIQSEAIRLIGQQRFALWSVKNLIHLKKYRAKVSYLPQHSDDYKLHAFHNKCQDTLRNNPFNLPSHSLSFADDSLCSDTEFNEVTDSVRSRVDSWYSVNSHKSTYFSITDSMYHSLEGAAEIKDEIFTYGPPSNLPALTTALHTNQNWAIVEEDFVLIHILNVSHVSSNCFISPLSKIDDGLMYMIMVKGSITRSEFLTFLLGMSGGRSCFSYTLKPKRMSMNVTIVIFSININNL